MRPTRRAEWLFNPFAQGDCAIAFRIVSAARSPRISVTSIDEG